MTDRQADGNNAGYVGTYRVAFDGALTGERLPGDVRRSLAELFNHNEQALEPLFDGRRHIIKRGASWQTACRIAGRFQDAGAASEVELETSPDLWRQSLIKPTTEEPFAPGKRGFNFRIAGVIPLIMLWRGRLSSIEDDAGERVASLTNRRLATGAAFRWPLAFVVALFMEVQLISALATGLSRPALVLVGMSTFLPVLYVLGALLRRPRYLQARLGLSSGQGVMDLYEHWGWPGARRRFTMHDGTNTWQLVRYAGKSRLEVFDADGALVVTAEPRGDSAGQAAADLTGELRDELVPFQWLADVLGVPIPGLSGRRVWSFFDAQGVEWARLTRGYRCRWVEKRPASRQPEPMPLAVALVLSGI
jgi:hypothetical protein